MAFHIKPIFNAKDSFEDTLNYLRKHKKVKDYQDEDGKWRYTTLPIITKFRLREMLNARIQEN